MEIRAPARLRRLLGLTAGARTVTHALRDVAQDVVYPAFGSIDDDPLTAVFDRLATDRTVTISHRGAGGHRRDSHGGALVGL